MKKFIGIVLTFVSVISLSLNFYFYKNIREQNRVADVVDGDTFQLASGKRVRLLGVDAPEYDRCGGPEAKEKLSSLIKDKVVDLKEEHQEAYGRSLALVYQNGRFVNQEIMRDGLGVPDYQKSSQRDILTRTYHQARDSKKGIFSLCKETGSPPDPNCVIKGNIDKSTYEKFYHLPGCKQYGQVVIDKDIGEGYFCSEKEAQAAGFKKASGCP
ncbi:hypothetical protein COS50_00130 [Candidatus Roizmanbacteria bacterium CG03_land_8_20_14_0_80_35_26]|uniref:TNase-like domain-containing protein n=1 Tax=Candidatus Roizmanbacteria bacterium CG03_land_8_20_14_0_80_35_26 TaxID=1974845 RepID=A0A2M7BXZ4_9BACT|nr:MAG: hypothetical protein COS50_00130 [Candidatus Roizmanbacteria bacterium CG03_land_8_20_14_0_80_35_26]